MTGGQFVPDRLPKADNGNATYENGEPHPQCDECHRPQQGPKATSTHGSPRAQRHARRGPTPSGPVSRAAAPIPIVPIGENGLKPHLGKMGKTG